jgi:peptidoglycan/LPS O-acetylase OafA/YrhL
MWTRLKHAYALRRNVESIYRRPPSREASVDGLRALSMFWVMATHVCLALSVFVDHATFRRLVDTLSPAFSWIWHGEKSLDTFFTISGYLIGGMLFAEHKRTGHLRLGRFYARRYLRLTPAYVAAVLIVWASGAEPAKKAAYLWTNLLYVNNFLSCDKMFMDWTWTLAVEEQFYLVLPVLLLVLFFRTNHKVALMLALFASSFAVRAYVLSLHPHITQTSFADHFFRDFPGFTCEYFESVYDNLYTRYGPFVVGVFLAWANTHHAAKIRGVFARRWVSDAFLVGGAVLCVALVAAPIYEPDASLSRFFLFWYAVVHRNIWSIAVGMGLLACLYPNGRLSRAAAGVLGARVWYPVAQLSYCTYLFHLGFVVVSYRIVAKILHPGIDPKLALSVFALPELGLTMVLTVMMSFTFGSIVYLLVERPFMNLRR